MENHKTSSRPSETYIDFWVLSNEKRIHQGAQLDAIAAIEALTARSDH